MQLQALRSNGFTRGMFAVMLAALLTLSLSGAAPAAGTTEQPLTQSEIKPIVGNWHLDNRESGQLAWAFEDHSLNQRDYHDLIKFLYDDWFLGVGERP